MKILFATDGSAHAEYAERFMANLLCQEHSSIDLNVVSVCPSPDLHLIGAKFPAAVLEAVDEFRQASQDVLDAVASRLKSRVNSIGESLLDGHAATSILEQIEESKPDLCVVGSHGWTFSERVFLGSVSNQVATHSECSVLVVKPRENVLDEVRCQTILIAEDGTGSAVKALSKLKEHCNSQEIQVRLVSVVENTFSVDPLMPEQFAGMQLREVEDKRTRLATLANQFRSDWKDIAFEVRSGHSVTREIIESAKENEADLIVVSSEPKSLLKRVFLGSTALGILHRSPCSVLIDR